MTKSELINRIARKYGVAESSPTEFFEIMLRRIAGRLMPGETAKLGDLGYFHFKKGKIKRKNESESTEPKYEYLDLIVFSRKPTLKFASGNVLIFTIPSELPESESDLDSHFSISFDKPVVPPLDDKSTSGIESDKAGDSGQQAADKVEAVLNDLEKIEIDGSESEVINVHGSSYDEDQLELELDEESKELNEIKLEDSKIHSSETMKSIAWDFGKNLSRQMEDRQFIEAEEENMEEEKGKEEVQEDIIPWDFGKIKWSEGEKEESEKPEKETEKPKKPFELSLTEEDEKEITGPALEETGEEKIDEQTDVPELEMDDFQVSDKDENEKIGNYERVRSVSSKFDKVKISSPSAKGIKEFIEETHTVSGKSNDYKKVKSKEEEFLTDKKETVEKTTRVKKEKQKEIKLNRYERNRRRKYGSRSSSGVVLLFILIISVIATGIYFLLKEIQKKNETVVQLAPVEGRNDNATYIERSYEIPVTYPYEKKDGEIEIAGINPSLLEEKKITQKPVETKMKETTKVQKPEEKVNAPKTITPDIPKNKSGKTPLDTYTQVESTIFKYGDVYVVQVASFRTKQAAEKEMRKYLNRGYNAFVEDAILAGRGTWHRVRVGNFKTLNEAKKFIRTKQK